MKKKKWNMKHYIGESQFEEIKKEEIKYYIKCYRKKYKRNNKCPNDPFSALEN